MLLNNETFRNYYLASKKTKPTQASDGNSNLENNNQEIEQDNQSFRSKLTEKNICKSKRIDKFGNPITKNGKQRITFIDKISPAKFTNIIDIESFKDYNKIEVIPTSKNAYNSCCYLF